MNLVLPIHKVILTLTLLFSSLIICATPILQNYIKNPKIHNIPTPGNYSHITQVRELLFHLGL